MKITKTEIAKLVPPEKGYALHWDDKLTGFGLRVTASGVISYILQQRIKGKQHRITLARYNRMTPDQARKLAKETMGKIAGGGDPVADKARHKAESVTLSEAFEDYISTRKNLKPLTIKDMRRSLDEVFKSRKNKPLSDLTRDKIKRIHANFGKSNSHTRANIAMRYLRAVFNFSMEQYVDAEGKPVITENPVSVLSSQKAWFSTKRRQSVIKPTELKGWYEAVEALENRDARDYLLLVILTGLRRSEALSLRWADIDLKHGTLTARDTKNREDHTLPMSNYLADMLKRRDEARTVGSVYVFESGRGRLSNLRYVLEKVREGSGVPFTIHDLRRTFATAADSLDVPGYAVKGLLNHKTMSDVTAGYVVIDTERLRVPMQKITDYFLKSWGVLKSADVLQAVSVGEEKHG